MKRMILLALAIAPAVTWGQSNNFTVEAKINEEITPAKAYLFYRLGNKAISDSATVNKGTFRFTGAITDPFRAELVLDHKGVGLAKLGQDADVLIMYLEKGKISVTAKDSIKNAVITGSRLNDENVKYLTFTASLEKAAAIINAEYAAAPADKKSDQNFVKNLKAKYDKILEEKQTLQRQYIKQNPDAYLSLVALQEISGQSIDVSVIEPIYKTLSERVRDTHAGQEFAKSIALARATSIGAMAPVFTQNDVNGKPVTLTDFRGKYVLLDFWASWCGPCRGENPNVVKVYQEYKNKNFTVLGVSLDRPGKKNDWLAAIKADGLDWTQVSDLKFWNNEVAKQYGISSIPQNYLIDPTGKIIGKGLRGEELSKKLASLLN